MAQGDVTIDGVGTLQCTLRAAEEISARFSDYVAAARRVEVLDHSAVVTIVAAGMGKKPDEVKASVFAAGVAIISGKVGEYLGYLARGGREAPVDGEGAPKGEA